MEAALKENSHVIGVVFQDDFSYRLRFLFDGVNSPNEAIGEIGKSRYICIYVPFSRYSYVHGSPVQVALFYCIRLQVVLSMLRKTVLSHTHAFSFGISKYHPNKQGPGTSLMWMKFMIHVCMQLHLLYIRMDCTPNVYLQGFKYKTYLPFFSPGLSLIPVSGTASCF